MIWCARSLLWYTNGDGLFFLFCLRSISANEPKCLVNKYLVMIIYYPIVPKTKKTCFRLPQDEMVNGALKINLPPNFLKLKYNVNILIYRMETYISGVSKTWLEHGRTDWECIHFDWLLIVRDCSWCILSKASQFFRDGCRHDNLRPVVYFLTPCVEGTEKLEDLVLGQGYVRSAIKLPNKVWFEKNGFTTVKVQKG